MIAEATRPIADVIESAKAGDMVAKNELVTRMQDDGCMRAISKYLYLNRLMEPDEVRSEFWLGVIIALPKVDVGIGDPLRFLSWSGTNRVKSRFRTVLRKNIIVECNACGVKAKLYRENGNYICKSCKSPDTTSYQIETNHTTITHGNPRLELEVQVKNNILEIDIDFFKPTLTNGERRVFDLIIAGIDRDSAQNYCVEIASKLGISPQRVSQYMKKIREKIGCIL